MPQATCFHCGEPIVSNVQFSARIEAQTRLFCCLGCQAVHETIVNGGLADFYLHRTLNAPTAVQLNQTQIDQYRLFDHPLIQQTFVSSLSPTGQQAELVIDNINCAACIWLLERAIEKQPGVTHFTVNHTTQRARLLWQPAQARLSDILLAIAQLGFGARPFVASEQEAQIKKQQRAAMTRLLIAGIGTMQNMMLAVPLYFGVVSGVSPAFIEFFRWFSWLVATPVVFYSARPFFEAAWRDIRFRYPTMDLSVSIAIGAAYLASAWITVFGGEEVYFDAVCMFTFFLTLGRFLEMRARYRSGIANAALNTVLPAVALRIQTADGEPTQMLMATHQLTPGDRILVKPGEIIPVDGVVSYGCSSVNESALTGEYFPSPKQSGDAVSAGTINMDQPLQICVERSGAQTRLSAISRIVDQVYQSKPRTLLLADQFAAYFVTGILLLSSLVFIGWTLSGSERAFAITLSVLVATCPCALSLAAPSALTSATHWLRNHGLLVAKSHLLEGLASADTIVFDKTGTLTEGKLLITAAQTFNQTQPTESLLAIAQALESQSEHPIARAFAANNNPVNSKLTATAVQNHPGSGVSGWIDGQRFFLGHADFIRQSCPHLPEQPSPQVPSSDSPEASQITLYLASPDQWLGRFLLGDKLREDAVVCIQKLRSLGLRPMILSGDHSNHVHWIAGQLQIKEAISGASPEQKLACLQALEQAGHQAIMVGDGLNDLPVMAGARLSIAMASAADITQLQADGILLTSHLSPLASAIVLARKTRQIIRQNLAWALGYNLSVLPLAILGMVPPWLAAIGMSASSLLVVLNALRLGKR